MDESCIFGQSSGTVSSVVKAPAAVVVGVPDVELVLLELDSGDILQLTDGQLGFGLSALIESYERTTLSHLFGRMPNIPPSVPAVAIASAAIIANSNVDAGTPHINLGLDAALL